MFYKNIDIILGSPWVQTLGTFILSTKKKFLTFSYKKKKKKKITLQNVKMKPCSKVPSLEDLKDVSEVILQDHQKPIQKLQDWKKNVTKSSLKR